MRDWNSYSDPSKFEEYEVCILPMRDWNLLNRNKRNSVWKVCILPMRDWNIKCHEQRGWQMAGLYLTYEGLKPANREDDQRWNGVCILPMRDWNTTIPSTICPFSSFVSYLWGIETDMIGRYIQGHSRVCILPMRDWNFSSFLSFLFVDTCVCILPMRDWNGIAWRPNAQCFRAVCILPMRDWNPDVINHVKRRGDLFVSYLWGIETRSWGRWCGRIYCLFLTYEGLKLKCKLFSFP